MAYFECDETGIYTPYAELETLPDRSSDFLRVARNAWRSIYRQDGRWVVGERIRVAPSDWWETRFKLHGRSEIADPARWA